MTWTLLISFALGAWTVLNIELLGRGNRLGFLSGLASQVLWVVFDLAVGAYGLLPLALILGWRYIVAYRRWGEAERARKAKAHQARLMPSTRNGSSRRSGGHERGRSAGGATHGRG